MPKPIKLKHHKTNASVSKYLKTLSDEQRAVAEKLLDLFANVTMAEAKLWGTSMIGFGEYEYSRSNGDTGSYFATGFAMRKSGPTIYIMSGYTDFSEILAKLGPHKLGKSCLYLKSLEGIHLPTLKKLVRAGLADLKKTYTVRL
jgi:hypothetical protein